MAYSIDQQEFMFGGGTLSTASSADIGVFASCYPQYLHKLVYTVVTATADAVVIKLDKIPANGGSRGDGDIGVLNVPISPTVGTCYYVQLNKTIIPGDVVVAQVTDNGGGSSAGILTMLHAPAHEVEGNLDYMIASS